MARAVAGPVSGAGVARRIATAAAYGGGGAGLLGGAAVGLLMAEVRLARRRVGGSDDVPPVADGVYGTAVASAGPGAQATPLRLAVLGDSTAAGQGVHRPRQTPGALLAAGLAAVAERPVRLRNVALSGACSDDLDRQVSRLLENGGTDGDGPPDVCVVMIGANDVTHRVPPAASVRLLRDAVARLRAAGCEVVVGTCPDLGTVEPVAQPLRWLARRMSRRLAAAQTVAVVEQGGRTVSLGDLLGPEFEANPRELFGPDNYHPSAEGYATAAMAFLPTLCAALDLWPEDDGSPGGPGAARRGGTLPAEGPLPAEGVLTTEGPLPAEGVLTTEEALPVEAAAAAAAGEGGTEVSGARGPLALLRRRRRRLPVAGAPEPAGAG
ncbi:SGNH/GDSL hydrolase family protein [Streptomyces sp. HK10]|uniref:SGNH/GDSL hydrolase family protein n=1 Tax=Streptomyces sp. HK10 TaxID=3373255 RepID=UPI003749202F